MKAFKIFSILVAMLLSAVSCNNGGNKEANITSFVVGSWQLISYCDMPAEVDLHIAFNKNATFRILQRTDSFEYQQFSGRYSVTVQTNAENPEFVEHLVSGVYSDGKAWANSYLCSLDENGNLVMQSVGSDEMSVYRPELMPKAAATRTVEADALCVKPL